jgi:HD superfamily phosphohydrolase YqeK
VEPVLLHGKVGACLARQELAIDNPDILEAIAFHITGGSNIGSLAQLVFIADFIEPGRRFEAARSLREMAPRISPEELLLRVYNYTIAYVLKKGYLIHPNSIAGRNELIKKGIKVSEDSWNKC